MATSVPIVGRDEGYIKRQHTSPIWGCNKGGVIPIFRVRRWSAENAQASNQVRVRTRMRGVPPRYSTADCRKCRWCECLDYLCYAKSNRVFFCCHDAYGLLPASPSSGHRSRSVYQTCGHKCLPGLPCGSWLLTVTCMWHNAEGFDTAAIVSASPDRRDVLRGC